jgi:hypothetical protein
VGGATRRSRSAGVLYVEHFINKGHTKWITVLLVLAGLWIPAAIRVYWAPFFLAGGALLLGIPVYLAQRRHLTPPTPVPPYR